MNHRVAGLLAFVLAIGAGAVAAILSDGPADRSSSDDPSVASAGVRVQRSATAATRAQNSASRLARDGARSAPLRQALRQDDEMRRSGIPDASTAVVRAMRESASLPRVSSGEESGSVVEASAEPGADQGAAGGAFARARAFSAPFDKSATTAENVAPLIEQNVEYDPEQAAAHFPPGAALAYPDAGGVDPEQGTIAFWLRREWDPTEPSSRPLVQLRTATWENRLEIGVGSTYLGFNITTGEGGENGAGSPIGWGADEWHHVTATWGDSLMSVYIDGQLADQRPYNGALSLPSSTPLYMASTPSGPSLSDGPVSLRGFTVTRRAASPEDVQSLLAQPAAGK